jgi:hypothetical protein
MKKYSLAAVFGGAILAVVPASATTSTFNFTGGNGSDTYSSFPVNITVGTTSVTATATAYNFKQGTTQGQALGTATTLSTAQLGAYSGAGLGVCETGTTGATGTNQACGTPYHQINNGWNPGTGLTGQAQQDYEFILIAFSGAAVNLQSVELGNFGVPSGTADPFAVTYFYTSANSLTTPLAGMTFGALMGGADGFTQGSTDCSGTCVPGVVNGASTTATDALNVNDVTYLLIGASTASANSGKDFFKIQDLNISGTQSTTTSSPTPEPATFGMIGLALAGLGIYGRKRKSSSR